MTEWNFNSSNYEWLVGLYVATLLAQIPSDTADWYLDWDCMPTG